MQIGFMRGVAGFVLIGVASEVLVVSIKEADLLHVQERAPNYRHLQDVNYTDVSTSTGLSFQMAAIQR